MAQTETRGTFERSDAQRKRALENANRIRVFRSCLKQELTRGEKSLRDVLAEPPPEIASMKVFDLLRSVRGIGRVKTHKLLAHIGVSPSKTVAGLSERQRRDLLTRVR